MYLVDEQDGVAHLANIIEQSLDTAFKLATELGTCYQRGHIQQVKLLALQHRRNATVRQLLGNSLGNRGLADTRLTNQARVIFGAAVENLDDPLNLLFSADNAVDFALARLFGQVLTVCAEEFIFFLFLFFLALCTGKRPMTLLLHPVDGSVLIRLHRIRLLVLVPKLVLVHLLVVRAHRPRHIEHLHERHRLRAAHIKAVPEGVQQSRHLVVHRIQLLVGNAHLVQQVGDRLDVQLLGALEAQPLVNRFGPIHSGEKDNR